MSSGSGSGSGGAVLRSAERCVLSYRSPADVDAALSVQRSPADVDAALSVQRYASSSTHARAVLASNGRDVKVYCWTDPDTGEVCVTFPGTDDWIDVWVDLDAAAVRLHLPGEATPPVYVHEGFYRFFRSVEPLLTPMIEAELSRAQPSSEPSSELTRAQPSSSLVIAGHSMGGGVAQVAAAHYGGVFGVLGPLHGRRVEVSCHTFGSPRVGDAGFVRWFASRVRDNHRIVNARDPVPMLPALPFWQHTQGTCVSLDDSGGVRVVGAALDALRWRRLTDPVGVLFAWLWQRGHVWVWGGRSADPADSSPLMEHSVEAYVQRVRAYVGATLPGT
jgi:hypothetical protein